MDTESVLQTHTQIHTYIYIIYTYTIHTLYPHTIVCIYTHTIYNYINSLNIATTLSNISSYFITDLIKSTQFNVREKIDKITLELIKNNHLYFSLIFYYDIKKIHYIPKNKNKSNLNY